MKCYISCDKSISCGKALKDLVTMPQIILVNKFTEESFKIFSDLFSLAHQSEQNVIPVVIDSYGGELYSLNAMISLMKTSSVPVATVVEGKAMSCGCILSGMGTVGYRYCAPNAVIMMHDIFTFCIGKTEEIKADAKQRDLESNKLFRSLAEHCGHKDKNYFLKLLDKKKHAEIYFTAQEAKKHKLIDRIGIPEFKIELKTNYIFK